MKLETVKKGLRDSIEKLGRIISYMQKEYPKEGFLISELRSVQGFLSQIERELNED